MSKTETLSAKILREKYLMDGESCWSDVSKRVSNEVLRSIGASKSEIAETYEAITSKKFIPAGRFLYAAGRPLHQIYNCLSLDVEDSREGWANLLYESAMALQTGAGIGVRYNKIRPKGSLIHRTGGVASGVMSLVRMVNAIGEEVIQGGSRRSAILGMLHIAHPDAFDFINAKITDGVLKCTNLSIELQSPEETSNDLFDLVITRMYNNGEPGLIMNYDTDDVLANACSEMSATYSATPCCLGSINLGKVESIQEMEHLVNIGTRFLIAGTLYSDVPFPKVSQVMEKDRRIGLGLMGVAEFLAKHNEPYGESQRLEEYLRVYGNATAIANIHTRKLSISPVVKSRAVAPTGTISLVAETTGGIEPIFSEKYIREYYTKQGAIAVEQVVDVVAERIKRMYGLSKVETAYTIDIEKRLALQAQVQRYVDMRVSSTINFDRGNVSKDTLKKLIIKYSKGQLKGLTVYPRNGRGNSPVKPLDGLDVLNTSDCKQGYCNS